MPYDGLSLDIYVYIGLKDNILCGYAKNNFNLLFILTLNQYVRNDLDCLSLF